MRSDTETTETHMPRKLPQKVIGGRYVVLHRLGAGGMGEVYQVLDRLTGQVAALKRVTKLAFLDASPHDSGYLDPRLALAHEFQTLVSLRHPNIINVLDYGFDEQQLPYFTMSLLHNAFTIVEAGVNRPDDTKVMLLLQILQALSYLHRRGILHRDLKPANVLVTENSHLQVKVLDFGLASGRDSHHETQPVGTLAYIAPEVLLGRPPTAIADLYAVGVMAYELFTGRHPFNLNHVSDLIRSIIGEPPDVTQLRTSPGIVDVIGRLLQKDPGQRYPNADAVIDAFARAINRPVRETVDIREAVLQSAPFVGRDTEMSELLKGLNAAFAGDGSAFLVGGESGVGKSRLVDELRARALVKGALVYRGQCISDGASAFHVWRQVLSRLAVSAELSDLEAGVLKPLVPEIDRLVGRPVEHVARLEPEAAQKRLLDVILQICRRLQKPILVILEDLHWAGEASLAALKLLLPFTRELPLLIVATFRDDESPELYHDLSGMQPVRLQRLAREEIALISRTVLGTGERDQQLIDMLERETEGNVFFLVEVVRALAEEVGELGKVGLMTLPERVFAGGVQRIVQRRLERVPPKERDLLRLAAVAGRQIDLDLLHHLAPDVDLEAWVDVCANASVLDVQDGNWRFAHDKLREGLIDEISPDEQRADHRRIAQALEVVYHERIPEKLSALVYHWGQAGEALKEGHYALMAGEQALEGGLYRRSLMFLQRVYALENQLDLGEQVYARLRRQLGEVYYALGDYRNARAILIEGLRLYKALDNRLGQVRVLELLGNIELALGNSEEARKRLEDCLHTSRELGEALSIGKTARTLGVVYETLGDYERARQLFEEAIVIFEQTGDQMGHAGTLLNLGSIARRAGDLARSRQLFEAGLAIFEEIGFAWGIAYALTSLGDTLSALGDLSSARALHERAVAICRDIGHRWGQAYCLFNLSQVVFDLGDAAAAAQFIREALQTMDAIHAIPMVLHILTGFARLAISAERYASAVEMLTLAMNHSAIENETRSRMEDLLTQVSELLPAEMYLAAAEAGRNKPLEVLVAELLISH